jgi:uncharacterized protein
VPHFEKMLYDNALLAHAYLEAFRAAGVERHAATARRTLDFMLAELLTPDGGLASSLDADTEGVEGRFYAWSATELASALADAGMADDERVALARHWGVTGEGNWEGTNVLHRSGTDADPALVERGRLALLAARARRTRPARDEKQLAAWNGLALRAFSTASLVLADQRCTHAARQLVDFIRGQLIRDSDRLWRTARDGRAHTPAFAEDYACVADGLLVAHAALGDPEALLLALRLAERLVADFWDPESGTFADTSDEHDRTVARPHGVIDNATPSANAVAADVLLRLALLTGDEEMDRRARSVLRAVAPAFERQPTAFGRMLSSADRALGEPIDAVIAAPAVGDAGATGLSRAVAGPYAPDLVIGVVVPGGPHAAWPLFADKVPRAGEATAYVCRGYTCDAPTSDAAQATAQVMALGGT